MEKVTRAAAAAACACVLWASVVQAQSEPSEARKLLTRGTTHYELAEYDLAIEDFKAAYELAPAPGLLFDIAQAYRLKGGACQDAARFYRTYLRLAPDAPNRTLVEQRIDEMDHCDTPKPTVTVVTPPPKAPEPPPASESRDGASWFPIVVTAVGLGGAGLGLGLYLSADADYRAFQKTCSNGTCAPDLWQGSQRVEIAGMIGMVAGSALAIAGVIAWFVWPKHHAPVRDAHVTPWLAPGSMGVSVGGAL